MASFDPKLESVIHLGAIPTWLTPIGGFSFILAHERIIELLRASARRDYLNPEFLTQLTALELLESDGLDEMLWRFHAFHRRRLRFVAEILARDTGEYARPVLPGSFGCVWLHFDAADIGAHGEASTFSPDGSTESPLGAAGMCSYATPCPKRSLKRAWRASAHSAAQCLDKTRANATARFDSRTFEQRSF